MDGFLTVAEFARKRRVTPVRVRQWIAEGRLPATRVGPVYVIPASVKKPRKLAPHARKKAAGGQFQENLSP